jgi:hypothetical protein
MGCPLERPDRRGRPRRAVVKDQRHAFGRTAHPVVQSSTRLGFYELHRHHDLVRTIAHVRSEDFTLGQRLAD